MRHLVFLSAGLLLTACDPSMDLQGRDPHKYYAEHPKVNKLESRTVSRVVQFEHGKDELAPRDRNELYSALRDITPEATDTIMVQMSPAQNNNQKRRQNLRKVLRSFGYTNSALMFEPSQAVGSDEAQDVLSYSSVVLPDCPDWKLSPVTTYSNTSQGNFGCATTVNIGLMVVDPHDLVRGTGDHRLDTQRNMQVMSDYRAGRIKSSSNNGGNDSSQAAAAAAAAASPSSPSGQ